MVQLIVHPLSDVVPGGVHRMVAPEGPIHMAVGFRLPKVLYDFERPSVQLVPLFVVAKGPASL